MALFMDVAFSIAICASLVAIADGTCSDKNALKVLKKPVRVIKCQSAFKIDPRSASNFDPLWRRVRTVAVAPSELVGYLQLGGA
jgi:hypothetical protein